MAWIGFLALIAIGGYVVISGVAMQFFTSAFSGKNSIAGMALVIAGAFMLYLAWVNKPFIITAV